MILKFSCLPKILAVVGASCCGKSTLSYIVIASHSPTSGQFFYEGQHIDDLSSKETLLCHQRMQLILQNLMHLSIHEGVNVKLWENLFAFI